MTNPTRSCDQNMRFVVPKLMKIWTKTPICPFHLLSIIMTNPPKQKTYSHKPNEKRESKREPIRPLFLWLEIKIMIILKPKGVKESSDHLLQCQTTNHGKSITCLNNTSQIFQTVLSHMSIAIKTGDLMSVNEKLGPKPWFVTSPCAPK